MGKPFTMISLFGWEGFWPLLVRENYEEAKRIVERVVEKQGVPEDTVGYCITNFDCNGVALGDGFYQCEGEPSENPDWRKPGKAKWSWSSEPYQTRAREEREWWRLFIRDAKLDIEETT
jgi:hypothetical protein